MKIEAGAHNMTRNARSSLILIAVTATLLTLSSAAFAKGKTNVSSGDQTVNVRVNALPLIVGSSCGGVYPPPETFNRLGRS